MSTTPREDATAAPTVPWAVTEDCVATVPDFTLPSHVPVTVYPGNIEVLVPLDAPSFTDEDHSEPAQTEPEVKAPEPEKPKRVRKPAATKKAAPKAAAKTKPTARRKK